MSVLGKDGGGTSEEDLSGPTSMERASKPTSEEHASKPTFWGLLGIGFLALAGGITMFLYVVPKDMSSGQTGLSRDMALLFTNVFMEQKTFFNEKSRYSAALVELNVDPQACSRYSCRLTVPVNGDSYVFRMSHEGHTFAITEKAPIPKELKEGT